MLVSDQPTVTADAIDGAAQSLHAFAFRIGSVRRRTRGSEGWDQEGHNGKVYIDSPPK